jgi:hypothetical protein
LCTFSDRLCTFVVDSSPEDCCSCVEVGVVVVVVVLCVWVAESSDPLNVCAIATVAKTPATTSDAASTGQFLRIRWILVIPL